MSRSNVQQSVRYIDVRLILEQGESRRTFVNNEQLLYMVVKYMMSDLLKVKVHLHFYIKATDFFFSLH